MKVLLLIDSSSNSKAAVDEVANRSFPSNTKVCVLSVYEKISPINILKPQGVSCEYYAEVDGKAFKTAEKMTENAVKILHSKNTTLIVTTKIIEGSPKSAILKEAEIFGTDLIIVASYGHETFVDDFMLGSIPIWVAIHAKCSVEIVRK
ncbi:universal stress protein [Flavobacterium sp. LB1P62]|uniref:universal stress protein n=1 Tax=unclassified Flavobacterium TaxID=196869 RepID=UPI003AAAD8E0